MNSLCHVLKDVLFIFGRNVGIGCCVGIVVGTVRGIGVDVGIVVGTVRGIGVVVGIVVGTVRGAGAEEGTTKGRDVGVDCCIPLLYCVTGSPDTCVCWIVCPPKVC